MVKKIFSLSNIFACATFLLALVALILYAINFNVNGYFQGVRANNLVLLFILVMVFDLLIIGRSFLKFEGILEKVLDGVVWVLKVLVPLFLIIGTLKLIQSRIEGFGYIFFSNVDVAKEVATPANLASAGVSITALVFGILATVVGIVGAFFLPKKEEE